MDWKKEYEHGVIWQDFQHEKFIENLNNLLTIVIAKKKDEKAFMKGVNFSIQYCNNHFKTEEKYMLKHGYPRTENHIMQHNKFVKDLKGLIAAKSLDNSEKTSRLLNELMAWFSNHILTTDKNLAKFIIAYKLS